MCAWHNERPWGQSPGQNRNKKPSWVGAWLDHIHNRARSTSGEDWETGQGVVAFFLALTFLPLKRFEHRLDISS